MQFKVAHKILMIKIAVKRVHQKSDVPEISHMAVAVKVRVPYCMRISKFHIWGNGFGQLNKRLHIDVPVLKNLSRKFYRGGFREPSARDIDKAAFQTPFREELSASAHLKRLMYNAWKARHLDPCLKIDRLKV